MLEHIRLKPEGIRKIDKKMVVSLLCGFMFISVILFGLGIEPRNDSAAQEVKASVNQEVVAGTREKVNLESFESLPRNYAEQMSGQFEPNQSPAYMDPNAYGHYAAGDPRYNRTAPFDPYNDSRQGGAGEADQRERAADEARRSKIFFPETGASAKTMHAPQTSPSSPSYQMPPIPQGMMLAGSQGEPYTDQARKRAFLDEAKKSDEAVYLEHQIQEPISPYQVMAGTVLPAVLVTGINSDLPGQIIAQIRENIYDTVSGKYLLIPQGTRLIGTYDNQISWGQNRVMQVWTRMIFPNGSSILLGGMQGADLAGYSGARDKVNNHYGRVAGAVLMSTFLSVGSRQAGGNNTDGYYTTHPSVNRWRERQQAASTRQARSSSTGSSMSHPLSRSGRDTSSM